MTHLASPHAAPALAPVAAIGWADLAPHRSHLVRFAGHRLQDPALAEDLVHDVFEAVASGRASFAGRSALRTWLVGILKHKIVDLVRQRSSHQSLDAGWDEGEDDAPGAGHAALECPQPRPDLVAEQRQRLAQTLLRIAALPPALKRAVELRLLHDQSSAEVCDILQISEENLHVRLHRARKALLC